MRSVAAWVFAGLQVLAASSAAAGDAPGRPGPAAHPPGERPAWSRERVAVALGTEQSLGSPDAPVTVLEYTDYRCPACAGFQARTFPEIKKNFIDTGMVRFLVRDLPADSHPGSLEAAQAARCAGDQGKFREMHDLLSADPFRTEPGGFDRFARSLSLDGEEFRACLAEGRHLDGIREGGQAAASIGIRSVPSFVIGTVKGGVLEGVGIGGAQPYAVFEKAITDFLGGGTGRSR